MKLSTFSKLLEKFVFLSLVGHALGLTSTTCNDECQGNAILAFEFEQDSHAHAPLDEFYSIPKNFTPTMKPGTLLRVEAHTDLVNYTVPSGLSMSRIMYTSQNLNGTTVPASAFILWPYIPFQYKQAGKQHDQEHSQSKFPIVAWSHGTSGHFANCAPSNYRSLQYQFMTSYTLALEGFAVVATDYAGLGVTTRSDGEQTHEYFSGPTGANDVAYAIEAARQAFPGQLEKDGPFVSMGHSQGGNIAWSFSERQAKSPVAGYRGTIAISPPTRILELVDNAASIVASTPPASWPIWAPIVLNLQPAILAAITTVYPSYNFSGMTATTYDRWNHVLKPLQGCLPTVGKAFDGTNPIQAAKPGWTNNSIAQQWQKRVAVSGKVFKGPLLIIVGGGDLFPVEFLEQSVGASCGASGDQSLEMYTYQSMQHFPVIQASQSKWLSWIKERIGEGGGSVTRRNKGVCGENSFVVGFNTNYTQQYITPNWLVDWVDAAIGWKLAL